MVGVQEINAETGEEDLTYKNIRLLVGKKEPLEKAKAHLAEKVKGSYELEMREHAL
jgi:hypothetical protein